MPVLLLTIVLSGMGFGLVLPVFLFSAENLGASPLLATSIVASYPLGQFLMNPIWGRMSDRHGRKMILLVSMAGVFVAYLCHGLAAENLWTLALGRMLTGIPRGKCAGRHGLHRGHHARRENAHRAWDSSAAP